VRINHRTALQIYRITNTCCSDKDILKIPKRSNSNHTATCSETTRRSALWFKVLNKTSWHVRMIKTSHEDGIR
jgi:hypothetical protein